MLQYSQCFANVTVYSVVCKCCSILSVLQVLQYFQCVAACGLWFQHGGLFVCLLCSVPVFGLDFAVWVLQFKV